MTLGTEFILWMAGAVVWAMSGLIVIRYYLTDAELAGNNPGGGFKYMYFAQVFAGFAAFVLVQANDTRDSAAASIAQETSALRALVLVATASGMDGDGSISAAVKAYGEAVAADEWREMAHGARSPSAAQHFDRVLRAFHGAPVASSSRVATEMGSQLAVSAVAARNQRIDVAAGNAFDKMLWTAVVALALVAIAFNWALGPTSVFIHAVTTVMLSMTTAQMLHLGWLMGNPFTGTAALDPVHFLALPGL
ncbi:hypothetical protein N825_33140 [Skermanella stibiiresistens SB22]|uniref:DUF4239 domain-containing protein n=1 Tax=Skermanella stibiiresistens SB22 TaxID=1385369 RepID=W9H7N6_9PROT|nr:DUF4239 domain-containing protein [Skermanella stibiiresistens]EWY40776.1 hypothetical protein N825_33140 [Skermanella stibiiresistens SB22]